MRFFNESALEAGVMSAVLHFHRQAIITQGSLEMHYRLHQGLAIHDAPFNDDCEPECVELQRHICSKAFLM